MPTPLIRALRTLGGPCARLAGWLSQRKQLRDSTTRIDRGGDVRLAVVQAQLTIATEEARSATADRRVAVTQLAEANRQAREALRSPGVSEAVADLIQKMEGDLRR